MPHPHLNGASILIVEDEPLIAMEIITAFSTAGALLTTTNTIKHARILVEHDGLTAAILDHALPDGACTNICERLTALGIPYLMYSGVASIDDACKHAPFLSKPATRQQLLDAMEALIRDSKISN